MYVTITQSNLPEMLSVITQSVLDNRTISVDMTDTADELYINSPEYLNAARIAFPSMKQAILYLQQLKK